MAEDASDVKITKSDIEKLLTAKDDASLARFEKCEANWTKSEHWKQFWCPRIDGTVIKTFAICKTCSMILSVPYGTIQTLNRHHASHASAKGIAIAAAKTGQLKMTSFARPKQCPEQASFRFVFVSQLLLFVILYSLAVTFRFS
jgi:hypothetical protein